MADVIDIDNFKRGNGPSVIGGDEVMKGAAERRANRCAASDDCGSRKKGGGRTGDVGAGRRRLGNLLTLQARKDATGGVADARYKA